MDSQPVGRQAIPQILIDSWKIILKFLKKIGYSRYALPPLYLRSRHGLAPYLLRTCSVLAPYYIRSSVGLFSLFIRSNNGRGRVGNVATKSQHTLFFSVPVRSWRLCFVFDGTTQDNKIIRNDTFFNHEQKGSCKNLKPPCHVGRNLLVL